MTGSSREHLTWDNFANYFIAPQVPATHVVAGVPSVELFVAEGSAKIGLRVMQDDEPRVARLPFNAVGLAVIKRDGRFQLELSTEVQELYRPFFGVMLELSDAIQVDGQRVDEAVIDAMARLNMLSRRATGMSSEKQRGLMGELWFLQKILEKCDPGAIGSWLGFTGEEHDFRLEGVDIEVKTTSRAKRVHVIGSVEQLFPSGDRQLFLVSVHIAKSGSGSGMTLPSLVGSIKSLLGAGAPEQHSFASALQRAGYHDHDEHLYTTCYHLRNEPEAFEVTDEFPRITPRSLCEAVGADLVERVPRVSYEIDIQSMEPSMRAEALIDEYGCGVGNERT